MNIKTERLRIVDLDISMANDIYLLSKDDDMKKYLSDEVFDSEDEAREAIMSLIAYYENNDGPLVYPILLQDIVIGYVEAVPLHDQWEVGYHIGNKYTNNGYASESLSHFIPFIMKHMNIKELTGVCIKENVASIRVLEKCGFVKYYEGNAKYLHKETIVCKYIYKKELGKI